ncbi:Ring finger domain/RING-H2 zinc finger containing protein, putative [Leishmania donovani]|uniref:Ring finger domain/RING-H2 zinc finger containing protein, putative n=1 Tax=Leishmania donovani TaxID=5661 RepID=A0A3S5H6C5_LEIDO|nr:Ring finger domain/RING-H2 zinc finger containing protein, putative [Leishmania donovani]
MKSLAREFRELEATSQLPPSTPQQCLTPSTVLLPAAVGTVPPQLSPFVASTAAALSPQASIQMRMAPLLGLSSFPRSPLHNGSTTLQTTNDGCPDARADRVGSRSCSVINLFDWPSPPTPSVALRIGGGSRDSDPSGTTHAHAAPASRSADEDSALGPLTSSSSTATTRLSQGTPENSFMMNTTSAHQSNAEEATSATATANRTGSGSWRRSRSDARSDRDQRCSTTPPYPQVQAHHQQPLPACDASLAWVSTLACDPSGLSTLGVGGAASQPGPVHHYAPPFPSFAEGVCALYPLTSVMEPTAPAPAAAPSIPSRAASREQVNSGPPSMAAKHETLHQAPGQPQTPLSTTTVTASPMSPTTAPVQLSLQEKLLISAPLPPRSGRGTPSSTPRVAPSPPQRRCSSATNPFISTVGVKPNAGKSRRGSSTTTAAAAAAMAAAFTSSQLAPSPAAPATATPPSPPPCMRLRSTGNGAIAYSNPNSTSVCSILSTVAFVPIEVQPAIPSASPSFLATSPCQSPANAAVSASDSGTFISGVAAASAPPTFDRRLSAASAVPYTPSVPKMAALEQPGQASAGPRASATPPLQRNPAFPTAQPVQNPAHWSVPCTPAVPMKVFLAAPEMGWHSLTGGVTTPPASSVGVAILDPCSQNFFVGCGVRGTGASILDGCSSTASIAAPLATSPASSAALDSQRTSGSRGATWTSAGQTYRNVLVYGGGGTSGHGSGCATAVTASGNSHSLGLPLYSSQPQLLCTPVPLDDTESVCAICLEGRVSKTRTTETRETTALPSAPLQLPHAAEEGASQERDSAAAVMSDTMPADEGAERGAVRGVKPGSCLLSLPCGHCYHQNCVQRWLMESQSCPTCRRDLTRDATIN